MQAKYFSVQKENRTGLIKMNVNTATDALQAQINKATGENLGFDSWKLQCSSLIKSFCGSDSDEYKKLNQGSINVFTGYETSKQLKQARDIKINKVVGILQAAIETIKVKGLYKEPKKNILSNIS